MHRGRRGAPSTPPDTMWYRRYLLSLGVVLLAMLACNLAGGQSNRPDLAATITAQALTLEARARTAAAPTESPGAATETSTVTAAPVPAASTASATNPPQPTKTPKPSPVPTLTFTPTIGVPYTPGVPNFPTQFIASQSCAMYTAPDGTWFRYAITFSWRDNADNETGYRLYSKATTAGAADPLLADVGPNVTEVYLTGRTFTNQPPPPPYYEYYLYAFNDVGKSITMGLVLDTCR